MKRRPRLWITEIALALMIFAVSSHLATTYLVAGNTNAIGDPLTPALMIACGHGFTAGSGTPQYAAFVIRQVPALTCDQLSGPYLSTTTFLANHRNLVYMIAGAMRVGGMSWRVLDAVVGGVFGVSMVLVYLFLRLFLWRPLALAGVAAILCSNHLARVADLRDLSKEPAFIAVWLCLWWLWRCGRRPGASIYAPACVGGAVIGIGMGFRVDVVICVPLFAAAIAAAVRGWDRAALKTTSGALTAFAVAFAVTGGPTVLTMTHGSNSGHVTVLGLMKSFNDALGLDSPAYDIGDLYADGFARAMITIDADLVQHDPEVAGLGTPAYDRQGSRLVAEVGSNFPADMIARALGATAQVIRYPFTRVARRAYVEVPVLAQAPQLVFAEWRARLFSWVDGYALICAAIVCLAVTLRDWRTGIALAGGTLYFCGYTMLQFSRRHTFHLDVVAIGLVLFALQIMVSLAYGLVQRLWQRETAASSAAPAQPVLGLAALGTLIVAVSVVLTGARVWQQQHVVSILDRTIGMRWNAVTPTQEPLGLVQDSGAPLPTWYEIYWRNVDRWKSAVLLRVPQDATSNPEGTGRPITLQYFSVTVGGRSCGAAPVPIALKYSGPPSADYLYTRAFDISVDGTDHESRLLVPVLVWSGVSHFDGFGVPVDRVGCVRTIARAADSGAIPLPLLNATLRPDWRTRPLYQRLRWSGDDK